jgi:hypothetical protein
MSFCCFSKKGQLGESADDVGRLQVHVYRRVTDALTFFPTPREHEEKQQTIKGHSVPDRHKRVLVLASISWFLEASFLARRFFKLQSK